MDDKTNLKKIVTSLIGAMALLGSVIGGLHYENHNFLQGSLHTIRAEVSKIKLLAQDCSESRKVLRSELTDLTRKVERQQGFIEGQEVIRTNKPKSSISKN